MTAEPGGVPAPGESGSVAPSRNWNVLGWALLVAGLAGVCIGTVLAGLSAYDIGRALGRCVIFLLFLALGAHFLRSLVEKPSLLRDGLVPGVLYLAVCGLVLAWSVREHIANKANKADAQTLATQMDNIVSRLEQSAEGNLDRSAYSTAVPEAKPGASSGEKMSVWLERAAQRSLSVSGAYQAAVAESRIDAVFTPGLLIKRQERAQARVRLQKMAVAIDALERGAKESVEAAEADIANLDLPATEARDFLAGFRRSQVKTRPLNQEFIAIQRDILVCAYDMLDLFDGIDPPPGLEDEVLVFESPAHHQRYQELIARLTRLATRESQINEELLELARTGRDNIRKRSI